ncbi:MAG: ribulose-phosphate 3-epimerase [Bacteroidales bacterium]
MSHLVAPSILNADFANLASEVEMINDSVADWLHLDIMDGVFVPNISFGFPVVEAVRDLSSKPLDVHLMIIDPDRYLERFRDAGASNLTVHYETCRNLHRTVTEIRRLGMKAGVTLNPHSPVMLLKDILPYIDMVLLMTVNPGYGGQTFIPGSINKIGELRSMIDEGGYDVLIEVDGGIDLQNAPVLVHAGVDVLVAGNTVFSSSDPVEVIRRLREPV